MQDGKSPGNQDNPISRREFTAFSLAAGVAAVAGVNVADAAVAVAEKDVEVRTPSGMCDAALMLPEGRGKWPAVILFPDAYGLRPVMRDMAKRLAADGYVVLVPNPYYRSSRAPGISPDFDFTSTVDRAKFQVLRDPITSEGIAQDATAFIAFLDSQPAVNKAVKAGVVGYCMGGMMTMRASAAVPGRVAAAASFHGAGLVTDKPDSPHLLVPKMQVQYYFGVATNDDARQPDAKSKLAEAFGSAKLPAKIEVYEGALHGWCVKGLPLEAGKPLYNEPQAERAWGELVSLFKRVLV